MRYKIPESVLVVIYTADLDVLLIRRADGMGDGQEFWQSVTGSKDHVGESWQETAVREVREETGIDCGAGNAVGAVLIDWHLENVYAIYPRWLHRYPPGVTHNREHLLGLRLPARCAVQLHEAEHDAHVWLPYRDAAEKCFSPSNAEAILLLDRLAHADADADPGGVAG